MILLSRSWPDKPGTTRSRREYTPGQPDVYQRSEEDSRHWQCDDKVTSLHAPDVVDCDRCVGEEKDQIHSHEVAQDTKSRYDRHARTDGPVQIQSLQRNDHKNDCEHEINPAWKPNILPPQDANQLRPQRASPDSQSGPCRQREGVGAPTYTRASTVDR